MQGHPAVHNVTQAMRMLKSFPVQHPDLAPIRELGQQAIRQSREAFMESRIDRYLGDVRRGDAPDRRNGHDRRWLLTGMGTVELAVPRTRTRSAVTVLETYARRERSVDRLILAAFVLGLSTRKVGEALQALLGERVSASTVSRVAEQLDVAVAAFHRRPLANRYRALVFDGVVRGARSGRGVVRRPVLVAPGITHDGKKEILDFVVARGESQPAWEAFLNDLYRRGLTGDGAAIAVCDGGAGLLAALPLVYPRVRVQRCWAHKARNVLDKVKRTEREAVRRALARISHAADPGRPPATRSGGRPTRPLATP
jgi:transposase-like protein